MAGYRQKDDKKFLNEYAEALLVQNDLKNRGRMELDKAVHTSDAMENNLDSQIDNQKKLLAALRKSRERQYQNLGNVKKISAQIRQEHGEDIVYKHEIIETPDIYTDWDRSVEENRRFAEKLGLDLSHPLADVFTDIEFAELSSNLAEKFDCLRLDKRDYAFASFAGVISGIVDAVFVGTIGKDASGSKLQGVSDDIMNKVVQVYARLNGWNGAGTGMDPTKSAIKFLENNSKVPFDARYGKDLLLSKEEAAGLSPANHHLRSLAHSPGVIGLIVGIFDILKGTTTLYIPGKGIQVLKNAANIGQISRNIFEAVHLWFSHIMSDIAGAGNAVNRGAGVPAPLAGVLQQFQAGKIPVSGKNYTVGEFTELLYVNGYDFRSFTAQMLPVLVNEALVRCYWFYKQYFFYGKELKESVPFGKARELQRLLLVAASTFSGIDAAHALLKTPVSVNFYLSLNYVQMADFGYHLFVNVKLEYQHRKVVRDMLETEIRDEWEELCRTDKGILEN